MAYHRTVQTWDVGLLVGQELGVSDWHSIDQDLISRFAEITHDRQGIHISPEAGMKAGFAGTIAHGFLTLSLLSVMAHEALPDIEGASVSINYGFDRVRFLAPVPAGSNVRGRFVARSAVMRGDALVLGVEATVEIDGGAKPALVAEWLTMWRLTSGV